VSTVDISEITMSVSPQWEEIRDGVARLCEGFPNEYWMKLDDDSCYPVEFVETLTESGFLARKNLEKGPPSPQNML
jgi:acyl-CoA dehydrogenase